ncbi:GIY-YIG nuclease family protein [Anaerohalosphaera lusitana]|uniref:GIY-YIG nuclease family protein n=1 Tax=Anaerohalosphaera lusitana TaxID=1936003 RepID=UPI0011BA58BF|nr:GIY-YIG nuclease family protein [Anaerohalosphaera lusitana]
MFYVYVLKNDSIGKRYVGQTNDLHRRLAEHNGSSLNPRRYTNKFPGKWVLVHCESYQSRSEAMQREKWLKSGAGRQWLDEQIGRASPPQAD